MASIKVNNKKYYLHKRINSGVLLNAFHRLENKYPIIIKNNDVYFGIFSELFVDKIYADLKKTDEYNLFLKIGDKTDIQFKRELISLAKSQIGRMKEKNLKVPAMIAQSVETLSSLNLDVADLMELHLVVYQLIKTVDDRINKAVEDEQFDVGIKLSVLRTLLR
jgi:hypothetical protein